MEKFPFALPMVLDGSTGISLYRRGMPRGVCTEAWCREHPEVVRELQRAFFDAGSDAVYAPTFAANRAKLAHFGLAEETEALNAALVAVSREGAGEGLVGGDMTTTGLFIEPFGEATFDEVLAVYREQASALAGAGADFLVAETMMNLYEVRAAVIAGRETGLPVFVSVTVDERGRTLSGATALTCYLAARSLGAAAFGLNCSFGPESMRAQIEAFAPYADIPVIAKPNAGMPSADDPLRYDLAPEAMGAAMTGLLEAGARVVGGCCGAGPEYVAAIRAAVDAFDCAAADAARPAPKPTGEMLCDAKDAVPLPEAPVFSAPVTCGDDLADDLAEAAEGADVVLVRVDTAEDAEGFAANAYLCGAPVCFVSASDAALERALLLYQGRAMVAKTSEAPAAGAIAAKYGALYR